MLKTFAFDPGLFLRLLLSLAQADVAHAQADPWRLRADSRHARQGDLHGQGVAAGVLHPITACLRGLVCLTRRRRGLHRVQGLAYGRQQKTKRHTGQVGGAEAKQLHQSVIDGQDAAIAVRHNDPVG